MNLFNQYKKDTSLSSEQLEKISGQLIKAGLDQAQKEDWANKLQTNYGVARPHAPKKTRILPLFLKIAAGLALLLAVYLLFPRSSAAPSLQAQVNQQLTSTIFPHSAIRKGANELDDLRYQFSQAYVGEDFALANTIGEQIRQGGNNTTDDLFFLGLSYLYSDQTEEAIPLLVDISQSLNNGGRFQREAQWFLALAYLKLSKNQLALPLLQDLEKTNSWKSREAASLLQQIKS